MSGWENVPKETTKQPATGAPRSRKRDAPAPVVAMTETDVIEDGEWITRIEYYFPHAWLLMLSILCAIGIYSAVGKLPNAPW